MLEDFRGGIIVAFHKNKGSKSDCGNNKGMHLIFCCEIFVCIHLNLLISVSKMSFPEAQCGFRPASSTVDIIFGVRQVRRRALSRTRPSTLSL